jgi:hypothetical protein
MLLMACFDARKRGLRQIQGPCQRCRAEVKPNKRTEAMSDCESLSKSQHRLIVNAVMEEMSSKMVM